ncbi:hypothetical protein NBO_352g0001 [Nosema bombycis CQ1]|uniref:Uncharacterized protein n=1 Tax=Nosema bombycis (strain CQ1 / CVCC 102059) TaxID=578461 RepID=R0MJC9_NOSB1|nr:hypothetical protein NBO_352g0001 [Nosema bombycis CQ1]|eukprot:EOB12868.1 hypothetical protein NBO_352g0001 [Nosema bombycis CQ1]
MKNLFYRFNLIFLILKNSFCTNVDDYNVSDDNAQMISDLKDACIEPSLYEEEASDDFEILELNDFNNLVNIIEEVHEVSDEEKTNEIAEDPNEHFTKILDELKNALLLTNEPLNHSIMLTFIDKTIDLINDLQEVNKNKVNGNIVTFKDFYHRTKSSINDLDDLFEEVDLLYEEKIKNRIYLKTDFKDNFIYLKGIVAGLKKEFERCSILFENIHQFDNAKKAYLLRQHQNNIVNMRSSIYCKTESNVEKQLGFLKHRFLN